MKLKLITLTTLLMISFTGCQKGRSTPGSDGEKHAVTLLLGMPTKSSVTETEANINNARIYVFSSNDNNLVLVKDVKSSVFNIYLTEGVYSFYTFVNFTSLPEKPSSIDEVYACTTYLTDNEPAKLVMTGALPDQEINSDASLGITVKRLVAKFTVNVTNNLKSPDLIAKGFQIEDIYITNVVGETNLGQTRIPDADGKWYNRMRYENGEADGMTSKLSLNKSVPHQQTVTVDEAFYAYPNPYSDPEDRTEWSVRCTRYVLRARIGNIPYYYPVTVTPVEANKHYIVSINVTAPGVDNPEAIPQTQNFAQVSIKISDWDDGGTIPQTF